MTASAAPRLIAERAPDPRLPVARLLDRDSATALHSPDDCGVIAVAGRIDGARVIAYCTDATKMGGALGADGARAHRAGGVGRALDIGVVDEVIDPANTRRRVAAALAEAAAGRGHHGNIPL